MDRWCSCVSGETTICGDGVGGDVDVDMESAYFSGDETPGGDNPTPDQDVVDDIGRALGVEYQDGEELRGELARLAAIETRAAK